MCMVDILYGRCYYVNKIGVTICTARGRPRGGGSVLKGDRLPVGRTQSHIHGTICLAGKS